MQADFGDRLNCQKTPVTNAMIKIATIKINVFCQDNQIPASTQPLHLFQSRPTAKSRNDLGDDDKFKRRKQREDRRERHPARIIGVDGQAQEEPNSI